MNKVPGVQQETASISGAFFVAQNLQPTADPYVLIEEIYAGYVRYRNSVGRRWEVFGVCDKRGNCLVGATINGEYVETIERARELALAYTGLDSPVTPEFRDCCPFTYNELPRVGEINGN